MYFAIQSGSTVFRLLINITSRKIILIYTQRQGASPISTTEQQEVFANLVIPS